VEPATYSIGVVASTVGLGDRASGMLLAEQGLLMSVNGLTQNELLNILPQEGEVTWIGLRPERRQALFEVDRVDATSTEGLIGDRFSSKRSRARQVTLIQSEHLAAAGSMLHREPLEPGVVRRNIVVRGVNLLAFKNHRFRVGTAVLKFTGLCHPCSRMEEVLGPGGYNAMRGHGGITAEVIQSGCIQVGDVVALWSEAGD
jgi:MOSC domain-containing protein YiiM